MSDPEEQRGSAEPPPNPDAHQDDPWRRPEPDQAPADPSAPPPAAPPSATPPPAAPPPPATPPPSPPPPAAPPPSTPPPAAPPAAGGQPVYGQAYPPPPYPAYGQPPPVDPGQPGPGPAGQYGQPQSPYGYGTSPYPGGYGYPPVAQNSGKATAVLVLGIASLVTLGACGIGLVAAIVALAMVGSARREIEESGGRLTGESMITAGRIMSWITVGLAVLIAVGFIVAIVATSGSSSAGGNI